METEICWLIAHKMLVVFWIVTSIKRERAFSERPMQIANFVATWGFCQDYNVWLNRRLAEVGRLSDKSLDGRYVTLRQHGRHLIVFGAELE